MVASIYFPRIWLWIFGDFLQIKIRKFINFPGVDTLSNDSLPLQEQLKDDMRIRFYLGHLANLNKAIRYGVVITLNIYIFVIKLDDFPKNKYYLNNINKKRHTKKIFSKRGAVQRSVDDDNWLLNRASFGKYFHNMIFLENCPSKFGIMF